MPTSKVLRQITKSTDDVEDDTTTKRPPLLSKQGTLNFNEMSRFNSKRTLYKLMDKGIVSNLVSVSAMNPLSTRLKAHLSKIGSLDPVTIPELRDHYDPCQPIEGPLLDPDTNVTYTGQLKDDMPDGWGIIITSKGDIVEGYFKEGMLDVYYRMLDRRGNYYQGGIRESVKHGYGVLRDSNGITIRTTWNKGEATGHTVISSEEDIPILKTFESQSKFRKTSEGHYIIFEGELKDGKKTGHCYVLDTSKKFSYEGNIINDLSQGQGTKNYFNGCKHVGNFSNGTENSLGSMYFPDGRVFTGKFFAGLPHGEGKLINNKGEAKSCEYNNGKLKFKPNSKDSTL